MKTITFCGQEIALTDEQIAAIRGWLDEPKQEPEKPVGQNNSPFQRENEVYLFIDDMGNIVSDFDAMQANSDAERQYAVANYCRDGILLEQRALHETLNRLLWRYSEEHGGDKQPWDGATNHWSVSLCNGKIGPDNWWYTRQMGVVYFPGKETAKAAIHDVVEPFMAAHPEFVW